MPRDDQAAALEHLVERRTGGRRKGLQQRIAVQIEGGPTIDQHVAIGEKPQRRSGRGKNSSRNPLRASHSVTVRDAALATSFPSGETATTACARSNERSNPVSAGGRSETQPVRPGHL